MDIYRKRINSLQDKISDNKRETGFLITDDKNIYYFTGLWDSNGYLLVYKDDAVLFVDFRYGEVAEKTVKSAKIVVFEKLFDSINRTIEEIGINSCYIETNKMTVNQYKNFSEKLCVKLLDDNVLDKAIEAMRIIKDGEEYLYLKKAQEITEKAYEKVLPLLKPGVSEREISVELEHQIKLLGAEDISFDLITIIGKKTSLPHGVPSDDKISQGDFFTFDIGSTYKGYHSDMTRTVCIGTPTEEMKNVYNIVLKAHKMALNAVKPGVKCSDIDKIAREYIYSSGYNGCFGHSTGHGVGLDIHEMPTVGPNSDVVLKKGMVITIEPGIYLKDKFGVRIEDTVIVTENGCESFANVTKELTTL